MYILHALELRTEFLITALHFKKYWLLKKRSQGPCQNLQQSIPEMAFIIVNIAR